MKKSILFASFLLPIVLIASCAKKEPHPDKNGTGTVIPPEEFFFKSMPALIVELGVSLSEVEAAEAAAGSTEKMRTDAAGYTTLGYTTTDKHVPYRLYMIKNSEKKLTIASLVLVPNKAIWGGNQELLPAFRDLFSANGWGFKVRTDKNGGKSYFFIKPEAKDGYTVVECRVNKEPAGNRYVEEECTRLSYCRTDVVD